MNVVYKLKHECVATSAIVVHFSRCRLIALGPFVVVAHARAALIRPMQLIKQS